ncbi:MAG: hypothetical protein OMM_06936 [Candidatus Magnetoglobus multicellularis str. Araruama]|uniref:LamG-like jellyroll fold domain-containing protein n=1 Tax=Candidatus Magnetoglobus multicellularis str. Araruama TaxID=890399 RepID=A0A1V1PF64_9BACT|nr:MAG: hypothetical protein OMM_06936 [Candidatus Magnetoglobus multicellularis str. Araruama]
MESPQYINWEYSTYIFEETVALGAPVLFNTIPPEIRNTIAMDKKPRYVPSMLSEEDILFWSEHEKRVYPLIPNAAFDLEYDIDNANCKDLKVVLKIITTWPESSHIIHVAGTPPVHLDPDPFDDVMFKGFYHTESDAWVAEKLFTASQAGRSVLLLNRNFISDTQPKEIHCQLSNDGYIEVDTLGIPSTFTIEFYGKQKQTSHNDTAIISQGSNANGLMIGFDSDNKLIFNLSGNALKSNASYETDTWHHFAVVLERETQENNLDSFTCENQPFNDYCQWMDPRCFTQEYKGGYEIEDSVSNYNEYKYALRTCLIPDEEDEDILISYKRKIYCDGVLAASDTVSGIVLIDGNLRIGKTGTGWNMPSFNGSIDELRIWNTALTKETIIANKDQSLQGNESGLLHYFPMNRIGGSFIIDQVIDSHAWHIGTFVNLIPSRSWIVNTQKEFDLNALELSEKGNACVRVVKTQLETANVSEANANIGYEITSAYHDADVPHNGYVFFNKVPFNSAIYDPSTLQGAIYPVNSFHPAADARDKILVIWYRMQDRIAWPWKPVDYACQWPQENKRIVIASTLGSEGKDASAKDQTYPDKDNIEKNYFDPGRYQDVIIYNQSDRNLPGYNPNEEHAMVTASLRNAAMSPLPQAAFALRNDLNITSGTNFTSKPLVLVQLFDTLEKKYIMIPYHIVKEDPSCSYSFNYYMKAAEPVVPPYPLNEVIGATPPSEIFGKNSDPAQKCYWKDHKGQSWAISGSGHPVKINSVSMTSSNDDETVYQLNLDNHTILSGHLYSVKATDSRGTIGYFKFKANIHNPEAQNGAVYVEGLPASGFAEKQLIVKLHPGTTGLNENNFQLFHYSNDHTISSYFWYPVHPSFWINEGTNGNGLGEEVGKSISWLSESNVFDGEGFPEDMIGKDKSVEVTYNVTWPDDVPVLRSGESLTFPGGETRTDDTTYPGLPGVLGWAAGQVVYDSLNPSLSTADIASDFSARLIPALLERRVPFSLDDFPGDLKPASGRVDILMNMWFFKELHAGIRTRIFYDPTLQELVFRGFINDKTLGDATLTASPPAIYTLQPNVMTDRELTAIKQIEGANTKFKSAVDDLYELSKNPKKLSIDTYTVGLEKLLNQLSVMLEKYPKKTKTLKDMYISWLGLNSVDNKETIIPQISFGPGLSLIPNPEFMDPSNAKYKDIQEGYITLAENNHPDMGGLPVSLHIVKLVKEEVRGAIKVVSSGNVFDEKLILRHSADFGGNVKNLVFQWRYREDDGIQAATPDVAATQWLAFPDPLNENGLGMNEICLAGAGSVLLVDNMFFVRYRHKNSDPANPSSWSDWAGAANSKPGNFQPQLAEGWVKRVLNAVNPFEARIKEFYNIDNPATYVSMISQAGPRYEGAIAFNPNKNVIENVGLIELYQTVLERAKDLSINLEQPATTPGVMNALLLAATRIADFYRLLGNEAYNDALDPTIGFGSNSVEYGSLAPTIFSFQNQVASLLEEELSLLRGMPAGGARPAYNRLLWNFTRAEGEVAYAMSYYMTDKNRDGLIDIDDARMLYPQGHGDAWGHYLTALKVYYDLMGHPNFNWNPRSEKFSIQGVVIDVDYFDERKFAETAASKAKTGHDIVNLTYRENYVEDPDGQWQGYKDTDQEREWGVEGWSRRTFTGSYFDWLMANAILPSKDTENNGIKKIDRTTTEDILEIASQARQIENQMANANQGLNPLGLSSDIVPFDIDPARLIPGAYNVATQFEQVYERAEKAMKNAQVIFDHANDLKNRIRQNAVSTEEFAQEVYEKDMEYRNQLIEVFGTPYEGNVGPGKAYPPGYQGPDYYFYNYIDVNEVTNETVDNPSEIIHGYFDANIIKTYDVTLKPNDATYIETTVDYSRFFNSDNSLVDSNVDLSEQLNIELPISTDLYAFHAPEDWGLRRSPGEIQQALMELLQAEIYLKISIADYNDLLRDIKAGLEIMKARDGLNEEELSIGTWEQEHVKSLNENMREWSMAANSAEVSADGVWNLALAACGGLPTSVGLSSDPSFGVRGAVLLGAQALQMAAQGFTVGAESEIDKLETEKDDNEFIADTNLQLGAYRYDIQQQLKEVERDLASEVAKRLEIFRNKENVRKVADKYRSVLAKGLRLIEERRVFNAKVAAKTQGNRYQDMAFRINQNAALSKYRSAFDMAARYVYMTAKAYDYETNLNERDPASAQPLLNDIVHQRLLGQYLDGQYVIGRGGLGDIMARLKVNYDVLKTQMGFNNPQTETGRFSLRKELFRVKSDTSEETAWRDELKKHYVENLWTVAEFRKFCRPFARESSGNQPGLAIPFETNVIFGKNLFGWPLAGGDHAYDPTNFATKIRSVGMWFENYDNSQLSETPRIYLVPAGMDIMLVPNSTDMDHREWTIVDQRIPIPIPVGNSDINNPDWIPSVDGVNGSMTQIRRYSSFRAYHDSGYFDENQVSYDSRLVGRSVWNTRWMIIIPGGTFHYDPKHGIDTFIDTVSDIKLFFQTYAISGN